MTTTRRLLFQAAALLPFSKARAARKATSVYAQLGIRPVINLAGTQTDLRSLEDLGRTPRIHGGSFTGVRCPGRAAGKSG